MPKLELQLSGAMTRNLFIYIFLLLIGICLGQKDISTIELKVSLKEDLNKIKLPSDCGIFEANSLTFVYNVMEVIHGDYKAKTILINHRCPKQLVDKKLIANNTTYVYKLRPLKFAQNKKTSSDKTEYEVIE
jgi:hypothetical protein